jgi:ubiquinone/menaquinone biosynthesis C-methylase UbiE
MGKRLPVPDDRSYHLAEWRKSGDKAYLTSMLEPLDVKPGAVLLDVGCGSGYVSVYFSREKRVRRNLALDLVPQTLRLARELSAGRAQGPIHWICGQAEHLPVGTSSADHLVCRVVLPYTAITQAVSEISRSLSDGGSVLLQLHPWTLYARKLSLNPRKWKTSMALMLILLTGVIFHFTGVLFRPRLGRWRIGETFQTLSRMRTLLRRHELSIYKIQLQPEFIVYAVKSGNAGRS